MTEPFTARQVQSFLSALDPEIGAGAADIMATLLGQMKALYWFHWTAHWQTAGDYGDHLLFERMKDAVEEEIDPLAEKIVGYYGAGVVDPWHIMRHEHEGMAPERDHRSLLDRALILEHAFQQTLSGAYTTLDEINMLPMGLDDYFQAVANTHDTHIFLLQQRLGGKPPGRRAYFNSLERSWQGQSTFRPMRHAEDDEDWDDWEDAGLMEDL